MNLNRICPKFLATCFMMRQSRVIRQKLCELNPTPPAHPTPSRRLLHLPLGPTSKPTRKICRRPIRPRIPIKSASIRPKPRHRRIKKHPHRLHIPPRPTVPRHTHFRRNTLPIHIQCLPYREFPSADGDRGCSSYERCGHAADRRVRGVAEPGLVLGWGAEAVLHYVGFAVGGVVVVVTISRDGGIAGRGPFGGVYDAAVG